MESIITSVSDLDAAVRGAVYLDDALFRQAAHVASVTNSNRCVILSRVQLSDV